MWSLIFKKEYRTDSKEEQMHPNSSGLNLWDTQFCTRNYSLCVFFLSLTPPTYRSFTKGKSKSTTQYDTQANCCLDVPPLTSLTGMDGACWSFRTASHKRGWLWSDLGFHNLSLSHSQPLEHMFPPMIWHFPRTGPKQQFPSHTLSTLQL